MVEPDAVLEVTDRILDLGVTAMVGLETLLGVRAWVRDFNADNIRLLISDHTSSGAHP